MLISLLSLLPGEESGSAPAFSPKNSLAFNQYLNPISGSSGPGTSAPPSVCDTSTFSVTFGSGGDFQLVDVRSLANDEAVSAGKAMISGSNNYDGWLVKTDRY